MEEGHVSQPGQWPLKHVRVEQGVEMEAEEQVVGVEMVDA